MILCHVISKSCQVLKYKFTLLKPNKLSKAHTARMNEKKKKTQTKKDIWGFEYFKKSFMNSQGGSTLTRLASRDTKGPSLLMKP